MRLSALGVILAGMLAPLAAAATEDADPEPADSVMSEPVQGTAQTDLRPIDTVLYQPAGELDEFAVVSSNADLEKRLTQNPTVGLFKSMVLPGLGQLGNRKHIKAVFYFGMYAWMVGEALHYRNLAGHRRDLFEATADVGLRNYFYDEYRHFKDRRNRYTWFAVIVALLSMFDAYVDAHLSGFPLAGSEVGLEVEPSDDGLRAGVSYSF